MATAHSPQCTDSNHSTDFDEIDAHLLEQTVEKLVRYGHQVGVTPEEMISVLTSALASTICSPSLLRNLQEPHEPCAFIIEASTGIEHVRGALRHRLRSVSVPAERNLGTHREAAGAEDHKKKEAGMQRHDPECRQCDENSRQKEQGWSDVAVCSPTPGCIC